MRSRSVDSLSASFHNAKYRCVSADGKYHVAFPLTPALSRRERFHERVFAICAPEPRRSAGF